MSLASLEKEIAKLNGKSKYAIVYGSLEMSEYNAFRRRGEIGLGILAENPEDFIGLLHAKKASDSLSVNNFFIQVRGMESCSIGIHPKGYGFLPNSYESTILSRAAIPVGKSCYYADESHAFWVMMWRKFYSMPKNESTLFPVERKIFSNMLDSVVGGYVGERKYKG